MQKCTVGILAAAVVVAASLSFVPYVNAEASGPVALGKYACIEGGDNVARQQGRAECDARAEQCGFGVGLLLPQSVIQPQYPSCPDNAVLWACFGVGPRGSYDPDVCP